MRSLHKKQLLYKYNSNTCLKAHNQNIKMVCITCLGRNIAHVHYLSVVHENSIQLIMIFKDNFKKT